MKAGVTRPLVFVDVDGVLIPFRPRPSTPRGRGVGVHGGDGSGNPLLERLDPDDGRRLLNLPGDLVWASTWMADANDVVAPRPGLPALPVVDWPDDDEDGPQPGASLHRKTVALSRWAAGRAFVWLDDEMTGVEVVSDGEASRPAVLGGWLSHREAGVVGDQFHGGCYLPSREKR